MSDIDLSVIGKKRGPIEFEYTENDAILYALSIGASTDELAFIYENAPGGFKIFPSFCVVPAFRAFPNPGKDIDWTRFLHGEQIIRLSGPIPPRGKIIQEGEVTHIYDKGKGAVYRIQIVGHMDSGEHLFDAVWSIFYLDGGGFGGDPGPKAETINPPEGVAPDFSITYSVADNQAALHRLCGDVNPLHIDPEAARRVGFERPILHGMCTYGFTVRAIVNGPLKGDATRLKEFKARFSDVVFPGDTLTIQGWKDNGNYIVQAKTERSIVLSNALARVA